MIYGTVKEDIPIKTKELIRGDTPFIKVPVSIIKPYNSADLVREYFDSLQKETGIPMDDHALNSNWRKIDNCWYYFKTICENRKHSHGLINELLGSYLAPYFHLETIKYKLGKMVDGNDTVIGLLSENIRKLNINYFYYNKLPPNKYYLYGLSGINERLINEHNKDFIIDMLNLISLDFYMSQSDREACNLLFKEESNQARLAPIYDYTNSFESIIGSFLYSTFFCRLNYPSTQVDDMLCNYPEFYNMLKSVIEINMDNLLRDIENDYQLNIPRLLKGYYLEEDENKKQIVKKCLKI